MARAPVPGRVWLATEVPKELADDFRACARAAERSISGQIRLLIREYVDKTSEAAGSANETVEADRVSAAA